VGSPDGYLLVAGIAVVALTILATVSLTSRRRRMRPPPAPPSDTTDVGFPGLAEFAAAHGWQGPRGDVALDFEEVHIVSMLAGPDRIGHVTLNDACTGHYRGMGILAGNALVTSPSGSQNAVGVVVVTLPYLLPKRHAVHAEPAVAEAIAQRDDWALEFSSGRLICVRHQAFGTVADLARTLDGVAEVVAAIPEDVVARFTVVMPRLPDGRISDPHDPDTLGDVLEQLTPAQRAAFIDQMRGLRRSRPR
jgi:hypothetical protein